MAVNLTTGYLFKLYAGVSGTTDDTLIDRLIDDVCELIAKACYRTFESTTYKIWLNGNGCDRLLLPEWPITRVYKITSDTDDVLDIKFTGGTHADVSVDLTNCLLHSVSTAGVETSSTLALADYKIISTLATAIEAVSGWATTIASGHSTDATLFLKPVFGENALTPDDATLVVPSEGYDVRVVSETNRIIERAFSFIFPRGHSNIFCWYTAGYTLPVDNVGHTALTINGDVPGGLTYTANAIINSVYRGRKKDTMMKSESIGDYSYTRGEIQSAIKQNWIDLQRYAKIEA